MFTLRKNYPELISPTYDFNELSNDGGMSGELNSKIKRDFYSSGILCCNILDCSDVQIYKSFEALINSLGCIPIRDAGRREVSVEGVAEELSSVDMKFPHVDPHSETSFSPTRPSLIGFVCLDIEHEAMVSGKTIIIDGNAAWSSISLALKKRLQSAYLDYSLEIALNPKKRIKGSSIREWYLDYEGVSDVFLNPGNQTLCLKFRTPFLATHPIHRKLSMANHFFIDLKTENQILERGLVDKDGNVIKLTETDLQEIYDSIHKHTRQLTWSKGKAIILDNFRYMHGRTAFDMNKRRNIYIKQMMRFSI